LTPGGTHYQLQVTLTDQLSSLAGIFYFCCFQCIILQLTDEINYVFLHLFSSLKSSCILQQFINRWHEHS